MIALAIVEVCVQKRLTIRLQPMKTKHIIMTTKTDMKIFVPPCFFGTKKCFVHGGDVGVASRYVNLNDSRLSQSAD